MKSTTFIAIASTMISFISCASEEKPQTNHYAECIRNLEYSGVCGKDHERELMCDVGMMHGYLLCYGDNIKKVSDLGCGNYSNCQDTYCKIYAFSRDVCGSK